MIRDAPLRTPTAEPLPDSITSRLAQGVRQMTEKTREKVQHGFDLSRGYLPVLLVVAVGSGLFYAGKVFERVSGRAEVVQTQQTKAEEKAEVEARRTSESLARLEGKIDAVQITLNIIPSIEARVISLESEVKRLERERRLLQDEVETIRGKRP